MPAHIGADSLKKPHHIVTLQFSEVVKDHANYEPISIKTKFSKKMFEFDRRKLLDIC